MPILEPRLQCWPQKYFGCTTRICIRISFGMDLGFGGFGMTEEVGMATVMAMAKEAWTATETATEEDPGAAMEMMMTT